MMKYVANSAPFYPIRPPRLWAGHLPEIASFVEQAESMRTKEEKILIPLLEQQLTPADFEAIAREMPSQGYAFLSKGPEARGFWFEEKTVEPRGCPGFPPERRAHLHR
jgi:hypothetical protein